MIDPIDAILNPRTIAIVGASPEPKKRGYRAIRMLLDEGYDGAIHPVHPRETSILGLRCHPTLTAIPGPVDVALVCTPAATLPAILEQCGAKGVKGAVVVSGGFSEAGDEGHALEQRAVSIARRCGVRLVGPNMNGIFSRRHNCNTSVWRDIPRGDLAVVSSSANMAHWLLARAWARRGPGFSTMLSVGNQADVAFHDLVAALGEDEGTRAVVAYVEGFRDGRAFVDVARRVTVRKPIVMYKAGRNAQGARMAHSHSGALAGDHAVTRGVLAQAGVTLVERPELLLPVAQALASMPPLRSRNIALISEGGGPITIAAEMLAERGMRLAPLTESTQAKIRGVIPRSTTIANPVDIAVLHDPSPRSYGHCARAILEDPGIDALLFVGWFGGYGLRQGEAVAAVEESVAADLAALVRETGKPIVVQSHYAHLDTPALERLRADGIPVMQEFDAAIESVCAASRCEEDRRRLGNTAADAAIPRSATIEHLLGRFRSEGSATLTEPAARALLATCDVPLPPHVLVRDEAQLAAAAAALGDGPLAMKIVCAQIAHKSEADGVRLNLRGEAALRAARSEVLAAARRYHSGAHLDGVLLTPMACPGVEMIVGMTHDPQFGPVVMCGLGGIFVEALRDVAFRAAPIDRDEARAMIAELRGHAVLTGARGRPPADVEALARLLVQVAALAIAIPEIAELDLNPVVVHDAGLSILDTRIVLRTA